MPSMYDMIREFGFPISMALTFGGVAIWIVKISITHFLKSIDEATIERKAMTEKFTTVIENHIVHNTQALGDLCGQMKDMQGEHRQFLMEIAKLNK